MKQVKAWNMGNPYTVHGQRIGAVLNDDNSIVFYDLDRMIDGFIPPDFFRDDSVRMPVHLAYMQSGWPYHSWHERLDYDAFMDLRNEAQEAARAAPSLQR